MVPEQGKFLFGCARRTSTSWCLLHRSMECWRARTDVECIALHHTGQQWRYCRQGDFLRNGLTPLELELWASAPSWILFQVYPTVLEEKGMWVSSRRMCHISILILLKELHFSIWWTYREYWASLEAQTLENLPAIQPWQRSQQRLI